MAGVGRPSSSSVTYTSSNVRGRAGIVASEVLTGTLGCLRPTIGCRPGREYAESERERALFAVQVGPDGFDGLLAKPPGGRDNRFIAHGAADPLVALAVLALELFQALELGVGGSFHSDEKDRAGKRL